jgi:hypothetical protein
MLISDFPIYEGKNYAPVKPLLELEEKTEPKQDDVTRQIKALYDELNGREQSLFEAMAETAYTIASFVQGKQIWERNYYNGGNWELAVAPKDLNPNKVRSFNKMQFQVSQMIEDIMSSNPDFEPEDMFKSYEFEKKVKASKACWNYYERKFYGGERGAWFNIQQAHSLITSGMAIEELVYDATAKSFSVFKEVWGEQQIQLSPGSGQCFDCGYAGQPDSFHQWDDPDKAKEYLETQKAAGSGDEEAQEYLKSQPLAALPQCPSCGSFETAVQDAHTESFPSVIGLEKYDLGDFRLNNLPVQSVRFDPAVRPEESSYFIDKQYFPLAKIKHIFGRDIKIAEGGDSDRCLDYLHKMARIGASIGGARMDLGDSKKAKVTTLIRMSLTLDQAAEIDIPNSGDLETISGGTLPSGQTLADVCEAAGADGCTIVGFNGLNHIYGIWPKTHKQRISSAVYFSKANAGTGRGAEDLTEIQKRWNRLDSQQVTAIDGASPGYAFVEGAVDEKHVKRIGFPNAKIPIRREFFNMTKNVEHFVKQFDPQQVAPQFFSYAAELEKMMQMTAHNVSMSGAVFDADNKTATGARILEATAQRITIPFLESKAGMRLGTAKNLLCGYKECFSSVSRKFTTGAGKRHVSQVEVTGDDIDPDISFIVVENSHIPQNFYLRKLDYVGFANALNAMAPQGGYLALKATDPKALNTMCKVFNVDLGEDDYDEITEICRLRLMNAFELAGLFGGILDAQAQLQQQMQMQTPTPAAPPVNSPMPQGAQPNNSLLTQSSDSNTISGVDSGEQPTGSDPTNSPQNRFYDLIFSHLDIPIRPAEKNQKGKADWFRDFLDTQEGLKLNSDQRDICFEFIWQHENAALINQAGQTAQASMMNLAANGPAMAIQAKAGQMLQAGSTAGDEQGTNEGSNLVSQPAK